MWQKTAEVNYENVKVYSDVIKIYQFAYGNI